MASRVVGEVSAFGYIRSSVHREVMIVVPSTTSFCSRFCTIVLFWKKITNEYMLSYSVYFKIDSYSIFTPKFLNVISRHIRLHTISQKQNHEKGNANRFKLQPPQYRYTANSHKI